MAKPTVTPTIPAIFVTLIHLLPRCLSLKSFRFICRLKVFLQPGYGEKIWDAKGKKGVFPSFFRDFNPAYGTVMRNLSICLAIAMMTFGKSHPEVALVIVLSFIIQVQAAAWYVRLSNRIFGPPET